MHPIIKWLKNTHLLDMYQGDHGGLRLLVDFIDFDWGVQSVCQFDMPSLPNFHLPTQNLEEQTTMVTQVFVSFVTMTLRDLGSYLSINLERVMGLI